MERNLSTEIGGYFGLDLPYYGDPFPNTYKFQSGRAALRAALECAAIKQVWLPAYICDSVIQAVKDSGATVQTYLLDDLLYLKNLASLQLDRSVLLYVNYFGLCQENTDRLLRQLPNNKLIIDNSQALFAPRCSSLATIYSVRKFVGVPDGGLLAVSGLDIKEPENEDKDSIERVKHLLLRMAYSAREGYSDYVNSEVTLSDTKPLRMSILTKRLLSSIDMERVKKRRRENFSQLAARLDEHNIRKWVLDKNSIPLCYPLLVDHDVDELKESLRRKGIFIPTYWPDVKMGAECNSIEYRLVRSCLAIPCDQRYSTMHMVDVADQIISAFYNK
jgi:hypothetical protein